MEKKEMIIEIKEKLKKGESLSKDDLDSLYGDYSVFNLFELRLFLVGIAYNIYKRPGEACKEFKDFYMLHDISILQKNNGTLSDEGLRFLYEVDSCICKDSKIMPKVLEKILSKRDRKEDLAYLFNCSEDMISLDEDDVLDNQIYYDGYTFICNLKDVDKISIPKATKVLYLNRVEDVKGLVIPEGVLVIWYNDKEYSREEFLELQKKSKYKFSGTPKVMSSDLTEGSSKRDVAAKVLKPNGFINNTILLLNIVLFGILSFIITLLILK